jgi:hypothetical protein
MGATLHATQSMLIFAIFMHSNACALTLALHRMVCLCTMHRKLALQSTGNPYSDNQGSSVNLSHSGMTLASLVGPCSTSERSLRRPVWTVH